MAIRHILILSLFVFAAPSFAEEKGSLPSKTITILPSIDTSPLNAAQPLQQALGQLFQSTKKFTVQFSNYSLSAFKENVLTQTFQRLDTDLMAFAYLEPERVSLFLFDWNRSKEYIVLSMPFAPIRGATTEAFQTVQYTLQTAFNQLIFYYNEEQFQPLPGLEEEVRKLAQQKGLNPEQQKTAVTKQLYKEFADTYDSPMHLGMNVGMARLAAAGESASVVQLGANFRYKFDEKWTGEFGLNLFNYIMMQVSGRYDLPLLKDKYVTLSAMGSIGYVLGSFSSVNGFMPTNYGAGSILFGPGFGIRIPLLGATINGDLRFLIGGSGSILLASYGITYAL